MIAHDFRLDESRMDRDGYEAFISISPGEFVGVQDIALFEIWSVSHIMVAVIVVFTNLLCP